MKNHLLGLTILTLLATGCQTVTPTPTPEEPVVENTAATESYTFGELGLELDYPADWKSELDPKREGKAWDSIVFTNANDERLMSIDCGFMGGGVGGYESVVTDEETRVIEKEGQEVEIGYTEYSEGGEVSNIVMSTKGCLIFVKPIVGGETAKEVFESIR